MKWLFITSLLNSDHKPPTDLFRLGHIWYPKEISYVKHKLQQRYLWKHCYHVQVCVFCASPRWHFYTGDPTRYFALKTDVEIRGDFNTSKSNPRGVSGHTADYEVQDQVLFHTSTQSRGSAWFLQHTERNGGECGRPKSNRHFRPSVQEEIPQKSVGPWPQRTEMIHLHIRKSKKSKRGRAVA